VVANKKVRVLRANQALWVTAKEEFTDGDGKKHRPGDEWLIKGPGSFVEPIEIQLKSQNPVSALLSLWPVGIHIFEGWVLALIGLVVALLFYYLW